MLDFVREQLADNPEALEAIQFAEDSAMILHDALLFLESVITVDWFN